MPPPLGAGALVVGAGGGELVAVAGAGGGLATVGGGVDAVDWTCAGAGMGTGAGARTVKVVTLGAALVPVESTSR